MPTHRLLGAHPGVVTMGVDEFTSSLIDTAAEVESVDWSPPYDGSATSLSALAPHHDRIVAANADAFERMTEASAIWRDVRTARAVVPGIEGRTILHAGPPVGWERMSGPQRGAVIGALLYEGWADTEASARELVASGQITLDACHDHNAVGPMAGVLSPSMPVVVVENDVHGNEAYTTLNEGLGEVLRFGAFGPQVLDHLSWIEETLAPVLRETLDQRDGVDLKLLSSKALQMGDELHNRNAAATSLLARELAPTMASLGDSRTADVLGFLGDNDHFFLNLSMAASKVAADAAADVPWSTVVTAMARNGTDFGLRVSGLGSTWFTTSAPVVDGLYFPDYDESDANPDMGDSSIAETTGLGGFAMAASPSITQFVGGTPTDALQFSREMYAITVGENTGYSIPALDFRGTPTAIDMLRVLETSTFPVINTGIAHRDPGVGQIGAGITRAPAACFLEAAAAFCESYLGSEVGQ